MSEVCTLNAEVEIPSVDAETAGFRLVDDAQFMEEFSWFNLVWVDDNGEHDIFSIEKKRETKFDNSIVARNPMTDTASPERMAKVAELAEYYAMAEKAAAPLEAARMAKGRKAAKAAGVKLTQDQLEEIAAGGSTEIPGFFDEDESDDS